MAAVSGDPPGRSHGMVQHPRLDAEVLESRRADSLQPYQRSRVNPARLALLLEPVGVSLQIAATLDEWINLKRQKTQSSNKFVQQIKKGFLVLATLGYKGIFLGMARTLRVQYPPAIYHPPSLEATAGQVR